MPEYQDALPAPVGGKILATVKGELSKRNLKTTR
ncbi:hypothetical protein AWB68_06410 [Caballeronia choica]|uniref:Uncharacterized protein n=1 Tax=Caballeronia choica TaxID=326476 RepID=A0A158KMD8_9BURK|nr:hypothetical protein AWB68_06410 [Caballeronia choica]